MPPKQATLGKFFDNPPGAKRAAPQQSKLAYSKRSRVNSANGEEDQSVVDGNVEHQATNGEISQVDSGKHEDGDTHMKEEDEEHDKDVKMESASSESPAKRSASAAAVDSDSSDDEPPIKKQRIKKEAEKAKDSAPAKDKSSMKAAKGRKEKQESNGVPARSKSQAKPQAVPVKSRKEEAGKTDARPQKAPSPDKQSLKTEENADEDEEASSQSEQDESEESEEEKPEVSAKAREKVQSTLAGKSKDPYADWKPGEPVPYAALCTTFSLIEMTTKRLEIQSHCSKFLQQVMRLTPDDLLPTVMLMVNKLAADYAGIELGIGESLIMKAIGETTGRNEKIIKADQKEIGDLGLVAAKSRSNQPTMFKPKPLTVRGVKEGLMSIAVVEGSGSQGRKVGGIKKLLSAADAHLAGKGSKGIDITKDKGGPSECKFIIRALEGKMRLGLAEKSIIVSLAQAMVMHETAQKGNKLPSTEDLAKGEKILKAVYNELPSYEVVIPAMVTNGIFHLREACKLQPGVPLKPMLAKPTKSITEVLDRFEGKDFSCEYKYDGERAQIHYIAHDSTQKYAQTSAPTAGKSDRGISNIFSRNSEDLSKKYPDILAKLPTWVKSSTKSFVLDCETVAWDTVEKKVLPFQQLMTRKRKDVKVEDVKVKVCVFAFDMLFLNGEALVNHPFRSRREALHDAFTEAEGEFLFAKYGNTSQLDEIQTLLEDSVAASCEGLMVKMLDGPESHYEPSRRSQNWLKVKKDYLNGAGDSLDLVVLGAYHGRGKRTSVYGAFLLACYNPSKETFETVCNIGTGFSEQVLESLHTSLQPLIIDRPKPFYAHSAVPKDQPDVWFEAKHVWEVKTADLTVSPRYRAAEDLMGAGAGGKGVSLRFPRFLRVRDDKRPEDATSSQGVAEMYRRQEGVGRSKGPSVDDDFEY
ncbi:MAG: hypothetical protein M1828_002758 [Chrysothrix sp. TS-e1954]|nr:MAG: hypothetical protein M1828_002758 [Chrysothrix sp. TS-e1954]